MKHFLAREKIHNYVNNPKYNKLIDVENSKKVSIDKCDDFAYIKINLSKNKIINEIKYKGEGCSIFISSLEVISEILLNKNIQNAIEILNNYIKYINNESENTIEELKIFSIIKNHISRKKCTTSIAKTIIDILESK